MNIEFDVTLQCNFSCINCNRHSNFNDLSSPHTGGKKNKVGLIENFGYDELYIIPRLNLKITDGELNVNENMTPAVMKREFLKKHHAMKYEK